MDTVIIFKVATVVQSIANYMGFIDSVSSDVKKLLHQSFRSAVDLMNFARNTNGELQKEYLLQALVKFVEATAVEENENLVSAYLGLAMCQHLLGDDKSANISLERLRNVELGLKESLKWSFATSIAQSRFQLHNRERRLEMYKNESLKVITESNR